MTVALPHRRSLLSAGLAPETIAVINAMTIKPGAARAAVYDRFIRTLKSTTVWYKLDAIYLWAAHDATAAVINIRNPGSNTCTFSGAPTFTANLNYACDGVDDIVDTNWNCSTSAIQFSQNSVSFGGRSYTTGQLAGTGFGQFDGADGVTIVFRNTSDNITFRLNHATASQCTGGVHTSGANFAAGNRSAASVMEFYKSGQALTINTNPTITALTVNNATLKLGISAGTFIAQAASSMYVGGSMDATQHAALYAADLAYMQAVGAV